MLKSRLARGDTVIGSWISLPSQAIAEILSNAGFDWIVVDLEHSSIDISQAADLIRTIDLAGTTPLVRLTSNDPNQIKRVMDAGARGIVVPMVNTRAEAQAAVDATRYLPSGSRGVGLARAQGYGATFEKYKEWQTAGPIVVVQIEHVKALQELEEIFNVEGVDAYMIGPYDLTSSLGMAGQFKSGQFKDITRKIKEIGRQSNCPSGIHIVEPDESKLKEAIDLGYQFIAYSVDIRMLDVAARRGAGVVRKESE